MICNKIRCSWCRHGWFVAYALLVLTCLMGGSALAQDLAHELDRKANEIYQQVFSPFCPGRSLNDCPSSKAHELKRDMRGKLEQGVPPEVVLEEVFQQYGNQYRAVPQYAGFGKLVWWAPALFLTLGLVVALVIARGKRVKGFLATAAVVESSETSSAPVSPELKARIEAELARLE